MLVEDYAIIRDAIRRRLNHFTHDFSVSGEAEDGEVGVTMALAGTWDIVLLDFSLPKLNGFEVLERVKAVKPDLPIVMLSSHPAYVFAEVAVAKGAAHYLEKGDMDLLVQVMRQVIAQTQSR